MSKNKEKKVDQVKKGDVGFLNNSSFTFFPTSPPARKNALLGANIAEIKKRSEKLDKFKELIYKLMKKDKHYLQLSHIKQKILSKGGAEYIVALMGWTAKYKKVGQEINKEKGFVFYQWECEIYDEENVLLGTGHSSCCNLERSKTRIGFGDALHFCDLIAKKRSLINVIISITGISDEFTQDEDIIEGQTKEKKAGANNNSVHTKTPVNKVFQVPALKKEGGGNTGVAKKADSPASPKPIEGIKLNDLLGRFKMEDTAAKLKEDPELKDFEIKIKEEKE